MLKLLNSNSFLNKISVQEASLGKFICPKCSTFCTNSKTEYEDHLRDNHIDYDQVSCIYCAVSFDFSKISNHIESHFEENLMSTNICNLCNISVKMDSQESVLEHLMFQHNNEIICPLCKIEYDDCSQLVEHINDNLKILYHCTFEGCQMKTNDNEELNFHKNVSGHISDSCFAEHTFNCLSSDVEEKFSFTDNIDELNLFDSSQLRSEINDDQNTNTDPDDLDNSKFDYIWPIKCRKELFTETFKNSDPKESAVIKEKLFSIEQFSVGISFKNEKKLYSCLKCDYAPQYSHWVVKRHILTTHCSMTFKDSRRCLMLIEFDRQTGKRGKKSEKRAKKPGKIKNSKRKFDFTLKIHYRGEMFSQVYRDSPNADNIRQKLMSVDNYSIGVVVANNKKVFYCLACNYISYHSHWDVRKHILSWHCSIATRDSKKCMKLIVLVDSHEIAPKNDEDAVPLSPEAPEVTEETGTKSEQYSQILKLICQMELFDPLVRRLTVDARSVLREKLGLANRFTVGIKLVKSKRSFHCTQCEYVSYYGHWDVRKHILIWHCGLSQTDAHRCMKLVDLSAGADEEGDEEKDDVGEPADGEDEGEEDDTQRQEAADEEDDAEEEEDEDEEDEEEQGELSEEMKEAFETPFYTGSGTLVRMHYPTGASHSFFPAATDEFLADFEKKMAVYNQCSLEVVYVDGVRCFVCVICGYKSLHNQGDVKKHVMARHCGIAGYLVRDCVKMCRRGTANKVAVTATADEDDDDNRLVPPTRKTSRQSCPPTVSPVKSSSSPEQPPEPAVVNSRKRTTVVPTATATTTTVAKRPRLSTTTAATTTTAVVVDDSKKIVIERDIELHYSEPILRNLCAIENVPDESFSQLKDQMRKYSQIRVRVGRKFNSSMFICSKCNWFTWKSIAVVADHVVASHTGIEQQWLPMVEMSIKLNPAGQLMTDSEISGIGWNGRPILPQRRSNLFTDLCRL